MIDHPREDPRRTRPFRRRLALARAAEAWEATWPALWPAVAVVAVFLVISLFDLWTWLPGWLHAAGLVGFAALLAWALWRARGAWRLPGANDGLRRMERASGLPHQALRAVGDRLAGSRDDPGTTALWRLYQERLRRSLGAVRVGPPRSDLPRRDPWALRALALLVLVVALVEAGGDAGRRLAAAFQPGIRVGPDGPPPQLSLWITPPDYTRRPPVLLEAGPPAAAGGEAEATPPPAAGTAPLRVPAGSEVLAQLHFPPAAADRITLALDGEGQEPFREVGESSLEATLELRESGRLAVTAPRGELGAWEVEVVPDAVPEIAFAEPPGATHRAVLRLAYEARDDYGVREVGLLLSRPEGEGGSGGGEPERLELIRPRSAGTEFTDTAYLDLTRHPWAGLPVVLQLEAVDGIEQRGLSEPQSIVLPAREFTHPVARAIIELRRRLAADPEQREEIGAALNRLAQFPEAYQNDPAVFLALRSTATRLYLDEAGEAVDEVMDTLWETALHLEDGALSIAERQLRELQEALKEALANDASDAELERLMDELQRAMEDYLEALAREAMQNAQQQPQPMDQMPISPDQLVSQQDLQQMLDMAREMMRTGAREAAQQMLAQLQEMLENLRTAQPGQMQQGQQMMGDLQDLIQRQQGLLDQSFRMSQQQGQQGRQGQQGQQGQQQGQQGRMGQGQEPSTGQAAADQEALRAALGELMRQLGENGMPIPRAMGQAELAMRDATGALQQNQPGQAIGPQGQALDLLREGGRALMDEMRQMMAGQGMQGQTPGQQQGIVGRDRPGRDPLGRPLYNQGNADLWGEFVPDQLDLGRARAILEELYRRASQRNRPPEELDYIERLLRRF